MNTKKIFRLMTIATMVGLVLSLSFCAKEKETVTVTETKTVTKTDTVTVTKTDTVVKTITVHDTTKVYVHDTTYISTGGKAVSGLATYKDNTGATLNAKGAVVTIFSGSAIDPNKVIAYTYADASGIYKFPMLVPGSYYIAAKYNTNNKNYKAIDGVDFATVPGYAITMASVDLTQNISLVNIPTTGTMKIAMDTTTGTGVGFKKVTLEGHSKVTFQGYHNQSDPTQQLLRGGFNVFKFASFVFDETNPANSAFKGYVTLSSINTFEPARDAVTGCVPQTLGVDTAKLSATTAQFVDQGNTDTAWFEALPGKIERYGNGYIAHGVLTAFYKHSSDVNVTPIVAPRVTPFKMDTAGGYGITSRIKTWDGLKDSIVTYDNTKFNKKISKNVDMYFEYQGKVKQVSGTSYSWMMTFEGEFTFNKLKDFYVVSTSVSDVIKVNAHVTMTGTKGLDY